MVHPCFVDQLQSFSAKAAAGFISNPNGKATKAEKVVAAIERITYKVVPSSVGSVEHRQGDSLGPENKHWFRVKFFQQYRLFYRYDSASKIIIYVWVNDEETLRAYGSKTDAYVTFRKMLDGGYPPSTFEELLKEAREL
jgi:toxin YhaV